MSEKLVPKLRFVDESWDTQKLGNICKITMGQSPSSSNYSENKEDTVLIQGNADLINGEVVPRVYTSEITKTSKPGDIILTVRAPVGDLAINEFNSCIGRGVCSIEGDKFIYYFLQSLKDKHVWERLSQGSTFESINSNDIKNLKIKMPSEKTQKSISNFLTSIDIKIRLLEKKYDYYQDFKKFLMQQIFAQKLRFENGCSWNECTLGSIGETYNGLSGLSKDNFEKGNSRYITYKSIFDNNILIEDLTENVELNNKTQNNVKKGDLFFTGSSETPEEVGMVSVLTFNIDDCYLNSFCFGYRLKDTKTINPLFLAYYLRSPIMRNKIQILAQGSTRFNLSKKEILKLKIEIPSITEQLKIIDLLQNTDKLINNVSNQINEINLFKKSLLQQMFV